MYVCSLCFSSGTKKSGRTYIQVWMYTQAWACLPSYEQLLFFSWVCVWGTRGQESHFCKGSGPRWSFLCPKPPPCVTPRCTLFICLSELTHRASSLPLPPACPARKPSHSKRLEMSIFNGREGQRRKVMSRAGLRLGATSRSFFYFILWFRTPLGFFVSIALISLRVSWRIFWFTVLVC